MEIEELSRTAIEYAIEEHGQLGPGLLKSATKNGRFMS